MATQGTLVARLWLSGNPNQKMLHAARDKFRCYFQHDPNKARAQMNNQLMCLDVYTNGEVTHD